MASTAKKKTTNLQAVLHTMILGQGSMIVGTGKFLSIDPKVDLRPFSTPYSFADNSPILLIDKNGELPALPPGHIASMLMMRYPAEMLAMLFSVNTSPLELYEWAKGSYQGGKKTMAYRKLKGAFGEAEVYKRLMSDFDIGGGGMFGTPIIRTTIGGRNGFANKFDIQQKN